MKQLLRLGLGLVFLLVALTSCRRDERTESQGNMQGKSVTLSLAAEVGFEPGGTDLKGLTFKLEDVEGKTIPRPQFTHGQRVAVHTILKSSTGVYAAQTLDWEWDARQRKLFLRHAGGNNFEVTGFTNDAGVKWYIAGLLAPGTTLNGTQVTVQGLRELRGVSGHIGDELGELNVPYAFGWTELSIETDKGSNSGGYLYAVSSEVATFHPLGALVGYTLGNKLTMGSYDFTPRGFTVTSDAYGDTGSFDLNTDIPNSQSQQALPKWTEVRGEMSYTFAQGHAPGAIAHESRADQVYYAWVMPHAIPPSVAQTSVMVKGESSRAETETYKDYTNTYYTDYTTEGKLSRGIPKGGKIHTFKVNATRRLALPFEYVTEYNLAGGQSFSSNAYRSAHRNWLLLEGVRGNLRFSNVLADGSYNSTPHDIDHFGYFNAYESAGIYHELYNPSSINLQAKVDEAFGLGKYFIPGTDQLYAAFWGIFFSFDLGYTESGSEFFEYNGQRFHSRAEIGNIVYPTQDWKNYVQYGIRFTPANNLSSIVRSRYWDVSQSAPISHTYQPLRDNSLKCAYRYSLFGRGTRSTYMTIEVIYLGDADFKEEGKTEFETIAQQDWWDSPTSSRFAKGLKQKITRTFTFHYDTQVIEDYYKIVSFLSSNMLLAPSGIPYPGGIYTDTYRVHTEKDYYKLVGIVRLFKVDPDME